MKAHHASCTALLIALIITLAGGEYPPVPRVVAEETYELAQAPVPVNNEPLSIKISGPHKPVLGDRPVWIATIKGDAGVPRWRVTPPSTGLIELLNGQAIEWEPPYAGEFTITVSVGGNNKTSADDVFNINVVPLVQQAPMAIPPANPQPVTPQGSSTGESILAAAPRDRVYWNSKVADLVSAVTSANKIAEARTVSGAVLSLITRIESSNFGGTEYVDDVRRQTIALLGPQAGAQWNPFFGGLGRDLTLQDLRFIEQALAHVALAANTKPKEI